MPGEDNNMLETTGWIPYDRSDVVADWREANSDEQQFCKESERASIHMDAYGEYTMNSGLGDNMFLKKVFRYRRYRNDN